MFSIKVFGNYRWLEERAVQPEVAHVLGLTVCWDWGAPSGAGRRVTGWAWQLCHVEGLAALGSDGTIREESVEDVHCVNMCKFMQSVLAGF